MIALERIAAAATLWIIAAGAVAAPVLMVSVDGMKPEYVLEAQSRGLKLPYLRSLVSEGTYATGVTGVWPTNTYPSHTTLVTGVSPSEHGILNNVEFDPQRHFKESWFWYGRQVKVPTLWQAAHAAGIATASIGWPVTVGAAGIDYLIPEYWRISGPTEELNPSDRWLIAALSLPASLPGEMQDAVGPYMMGNDTSRHGDEIKTNYAIEMLRKRRPGFMTLHLSSLDDAEHAHGVFSPEANRDLEAIDTLLGRLAAAAHGTDPASIVAVVSDHGFTQLTRRINLYIPFLHAGLIETAQDPATKSLKISSWKAEPWLASGMAAIVLHDPDDAATLHAVEKLLTTLAADPNNGIDSVLGRAEIARTGGFPDAAFLVVLKPGYYAGGELSGELVSDMPANHGGHGFSPEYPEMRASFFIAGVGIARHRNLGLIDMRAIAPTIAQLLGLSLPAGKAAALHVVAP
jgi:predicted AlkP superfamily pyrophosphatase or phosphodiesterase